MKRALREERGVKSGEVAVGSPNGRLALGAQKNDF
jgi:hypothetical protein